MSRPTYEHRQDGGWMRLSFVLALVGLIAAYQLDPRAGPALLVAAPVLLLVYLAFDGLTVRIAGDTLHWRFGRLGFPRGSVPIGDIADVSLTRTTFWEGWGVRLTRRGWLYNIAGFDALLIRRRNGKTFLLGSDEPRRLKGAIESAMDGLARSGGAQVQARR